MTIRLLEPGDEVALERYLLPRLDSSMFLLSNARTAGLRDGRDLNHGSYTAAFDGDLITGVAAHYRRGGIVLQAPDDPVALARAAARASRRPISALIGPAGQVARVAVALGVAPTMIQVDEEEDLFVLDLGRLIVPEPLRDRRLGWRRAGPDDHPLITRWRVGYALEVLGERERPELYESVAASIHREIARDSLWLLVKDSVPVALTGFNARLDEAVQVGGVWTPPPLRGRGYGRAVVAASLLDARDEGVARAILFTGEENVPAQRAYRALGFERVGDYRIMLLREPIPPLEG